MRPAGFARFFEGWQVGSITVALAVCAALLVVPRAAEPGPFPVPLVDVAEARHTRARYDAQADRAERQGLPFETRAVGDGVRRLGSALSGKLSSAEHQSRVLAERVAAARSFRQLDTLELLRDVQARLFVHAVRQHHFGGPASADLAELGGDFVARAVASGWVSGGRCLATDDELHTLFALRWVALTGLGDDARFKPSLGELRRYYRFLLLYPEGAGGADRERDRAHARLRYVAALSRRDTAYPADLARGSLLGALGMPVESAASLAQHLSRSTSANWTARARNYLMWVTPEPPEEP